MKVILRVIAIFCILSAIALVARGSCPEDVSCWRDESTCVTPPLRAGPKMVNVDNKFIWMWGGYFECFEPVLMNCDHEFHDDVWKYHLQNDKGWEEIQVSGPKPSPRTFFGAALWKNDPDVQYDSLVVIFGGTQYNATFTFFQNYGDIWFFDPYGETWSQITPINAGPDPRSGPNVAIYKNHMYVHGGVAGNLSVGLTLRGDLWKFNLNTLAWTLLHLETAPNVPIPTYLASFEVDRERKQIVMYGGSIVGAGTGDVTNATWLYSIENNVWTNVPDTIPARVHNCAAVVRDQLIISHGDLEIGPGSTGHCITSTISSGHKPTDETFALDLTTNQWTQLNTTCTTKIKRTTCARAGNRIFRWSGFGYTCKFGPPGIANWPEGMESLKIPLPDTAEDEEDE